MRILKRSREFLLYTKKETSSGLSLWLNTSCYFYLPRIFYERIYTITWLLWNVTSRDVNIVVKVNYFRFDCLRSTKTHNRHSHHENRRDLQHSWFLWRLEGHWDKFWWSIISDVSDRELLHFIFDTGSVLFNWNLQEQNASIVSLRQLNSFYWCRKH